MSKMAIVKFPSEVNIKSFYDVELCKLMAFINSNDPELIIDLQTTNKIYPEVICVLLAYLKYQHLTKGAFVFLLFGDSAELASFLDNAEFFYHAETLTLFSYDYMPGISINKYKGANTNKIKRFNVPNFSYYTEEQKKNIVVPDEVRAEVQNQVLDLYNNRYKSKFLSGISNQTEILPGLTEIVENAYKHSYAYPGSCCYYTFQSYGKQGFVFACSDIGVGLYESFHKKFLDQNNPINPKIFSKEEYESFFEDKRKKDLAAIFECIIYRIADRYTKGDIGFPFILRKLVIQNNGILTIRNGRISFTVNSTFAKSLFLLKDGVIVGYNTEKIRDLVTNISYHYRSKGPVTIHDDYFPGVHISVHIPVGGKEVR